MSATHTDKGANMAQGRTVHSLTVHLYCEHGAGNPQSILATIGNGAIRHHADNLPTFAAQRVNGNVQSALVDALQAFCGAQ